MYVQHCTIVFTNLLIVRHRKLYMEEQERVKDSKSRLKKDHPSLAVRRDSTQLELPSDKLLSWRRAVGVVSSASQLAVCMSELEVCIAWEKSNTIVVSEWSMPNNYYRGGVCRNRFLLGTARNISAVHVIKGV